MKREFGTILYPLGFYDDFLVFSANLRGIISAIHNVRMS